MALTLYEVLSLLISLAAFGFAYRVHRRQLAIEEERRAEERERALRANLTCELVPGNRPGSYRVEIVNHGPAAAENVMLSFQGTNPVVPSEMNNLPVAHLAPLSRFRLIAGLSMDMPRTFHAVLSWRDPDGTEREEPFTLSA